MDALYSVAEVVEATGGRAVDVDAASISSISIDSREIAPGALFVAIKGENFDGHDFVAQAIAGGAAAALVSRDRAEDLGGLPLVVVDDALEGLNALARFNRAHSSARIIAVTGSVGKTSTKEALRVALEPSGRTHASIKSFNNHWGVPLMLARMPRDTRFGVFEIGMSAAGEISPLSKLVRPHVALVTTVAPAHLEFFPSMAGIAAAKGEIFDGVEPGGIALIGDDHPHVAQLLETANAKGLRTITYGFETSADVRIYDYGNEGMESHAHVAGSNLEFQIVVPTLGRHTVYNAVGALLAAKVSSADFAGALAALKSHGAPEGRGIAFKLGDPARPITLIDESYNANPASMRAALEVFARMPTVSGRKLLVLGDMRELGVEASHYHAAMRDAVLASHADQVFLVGDHVAALAAVLPPRLVAARTQGVEEMVPHVMETLAPGDSVMIKGSNGLKLGKLVAHIRAQYSAQT